MSTHSPLIALAYFASLGYISAAEHIHGPDCEHDHPAEAKPAEHVHGPDCEHDHPAEAKPAEHVHGPDCDHDHPAVVKPAEHVHGPDCDHDHPAEAKPAEHVHGPDCDHDHPAETKPAEHVHGPDCDHDHPAETQPVEHVHGPECASSAAPQLIEVNSHARDIIALQTERALDAEKTLVHSLQGFLSTPTHAFESYALPNSGRLSLKVRSAQLVKKGDLLFTVESPDIAELVAQQKEAEASLQKLQNDIATMESRLTSLASADTRNRDLEEQLAFKKAEAAEQSAKIDTIALRLVSSAMGAELIPDGNRMLLGIHAQNDGRVGDIELREGSWAEQGASVLSTTNPSSLEIESSLYGSAAPQFREATASIPIGNKQVQVAGTLRISEQIDPVKQTRKVYFSPTTLPEGAHAGLLCRIDLFDQATNEQGTNIPNTAIVKVGVDDIVFVKHTEKVYEAVKVEVLDTRFDRSTVRGLKSGNTIVSKGGYELKFLLTGAGAQQKVIGHFHADGTFHEGEEH